MFANALLEHFCNIATVKLVVVYDTKIKGSNYEEHHTHEEADTLLPQQVIACIDDEGSWDVRVWSPDTDVFVLLLDLVAHGRLGEGNRLSFLTGKGSKYREIDIVNRVEAVGIHKTKALVGLHNFTVADWGGKFVGITKKTWINAFLQLDNRDHVITCMQNLGTRPVTHHLINYNLPDEVRDLEQFVCRVYCKDGPTNLPTLRWTLFRSRNLEGEMLPPTRASLLPHIVRANYIAMRDKSYTTNLPNLPPIEDNGWYSKDTMYVPVT